MTGLIQRSSCPRCGLVYSVSDWSTWVDLGACASCRDETRPFKRSVVFVCGPDMCGKTEIGKALSKRLLLPYYKASAERDAFLNQQDRFLNDIRYACPARLDLLRQFDRGAIFDRGYPCEYVYSRFFHRKSDDQAVLWLDQQYASMGATIVIATRKDFSNKQDDLDSSIKERQLTALSSLYDEFATVSKCRILKLYVDDEDLERELLEITKFIKEGL